MRIFVLFSSLLLLASCGTQDGTPLMAESDGDLAKGGASLQSGDFPAARASFDHAVAVLEQNPEHAVGERRLPDLAPERKSAITALVDPAGDRLLEAFRAGGATRGEVVAILSTYGGEPLRKRLGEAQEAVARQEAAAAAERAKQAAALAAERARTRWLLRLSSVGPTLDQQDIATLCAALSKRVAGAQVDLAKKEDAAPAFGTFTVALGWEQVSYNGASGFPDPMSTVPVAVKATVTAAGAETASPIDGSIVLASEKPAPATASIYQIVSLRDDNRTALVAAIAKQIADQPVITDADAWLAAATAAAGQAAKAPAWGWTFATKSVGANKQFGSYNSYASCAERLRAALGRKLAGVRLAEKGDAGSVAVQLGVIEVEYGGNSGGLRTSNGSAPVRMSLSVTATATGGKPITRTFTAKADAPDELPKDGLAGVVQSQTALLVDQLVAAIAADPELAKAVGP